MREYAPFPFLTDQERQAMAEAGMLAAAKDEWEVQQKAIQRIVNKELSRG